MKTILTKSLIALTVLAVPTLTKANDCDPTCFDFLPYAGAEAKWQNLPGRRDWSKTLPRSPWGGSIFAGARFSDYLSLEVGYTTLLKKTRSHTFANGENFFSNGDTGGATNSISTGVNSGYVDLNGYYPCFNECFDFIGSIGVSAMSPRINVRVTNLGPNGVNTGFLQNDAYLLGRLKGSTAAIFRLGAGAQYMLDDCIGLRGMVRFENTSSIRAKLPSPANFEAPFNTDALKKPFKDSVSVALGVFAAF